MKVILIGYMASGKSTIGKLLSEDLKIPYLDLDEYISDREEMSISEIFSKKGEIYFRIKESEYLKEVLRSRDAFILSLGGGTPCYSGNMDFINSQEVTSFYLRASIPTITRRLVNGKFKRPLVAHLEAHEISEFVGKHLFERQVFYNQASHVIAVDQKTKYQVVEEIKQRLD